MKRLLVAFLVVQVLGCRSSLASPDELTLGTGYSWGSLDHEAWKAPVDGEETAVFGSLTWYLSRQEPVICHRPVSPVDFTSFEPPEQKCGPEPVLDEVPETPVCSASGEGPLLEGSNAPWWWGGSLAVVLALAGGETWRRKRVRSQE